MKIYVNKQHKIQILLNKKEKECVISNIDASGNVIQHTSGKLSELSEELSIKASRHFNVDLREYGVKIINNELEMSN